MPVLTSPDGEPTCVVDEPSSVTELIGLSGFDFVAHCAMLCTSDADCSGFNLKTQLCEMYSYEPSRFVRVPDCEYRQVSSKSQSGKSVPDK